MGWGAKKAAAPQPPLTERLAAAGDTVEELIEHTTMPTDDVDPAMTDELVWMRHCANKGWPVQRQYDELRNFVRVKKLYSEANNFVRRKK